MADAKALITTVILFLFCISSNAKTYNVVNFGAKGNGQTDSTQAFLEAWASACGSNEPSTVYVPKGYFLVNAISLNGPCKNRIRFQVERNGTLLAPNNYKALGTSGYWVLFHSVSGLSIVGGTFNGQGEAFWSCRNNKSSGCPVGSGARVSPQLPRNLYTCCKNNSLNSFLTYLTFHNKCTTSK